MTVEIVLSLDPLTIGHFVFGGEPPQRVDIGGSPQLFQTGESYRQIPLSNTQRPA